MHILQNRTVNTFAALSILIFLSVIILSDVSYPDLFSFIGLVVIAVWLLQKSIHEIPLRVQQGIIVIALILLVIMRFASSAVVGEATDAVLQWGIVAFGSLLTAVVLVMTAALLPEENAKTVSAQKSRNVVKTVGLLSILMLVGLVTVSSNLSENSFQNDEWYQVEAAEGYNQTGDFVLWDFNTESVRTNQLGEPLPYTRVSAYTWQVAKSVQYFGWSESAARAPSVIWYLALLLVSFGFMRWWKKDLALAFITTLTIALFDHMVLHGRLVRMYGMLLTFGIGASWAWIAAYTASIQKKIVWSTLLIQITAGVVLSAVAVYTHPMFLLSFPLLGLFILIDAVVQYVLQRKVQTGTLMWIIAGAVGVIGIGVLLYASEQMHLLGFIGWRSVPNTIYEVFSVIDFPFIPIAATVYIWAVWNHIKGTDSTGRFLAVVSFGAVLLFVISIKRYDALRYSMVYTPMVVMVVVEWWYRAGKKVTSTFTSRTKLQLAIGLGIIAITIIPLSWPGVSPNGVFTRARADMTNAEGYGVNVEAAYAYIQEHRQPDEAVIGLLFRSYYWHDPTARLLPIGTEKSMTKADIKALMLEEGRGWIVWSEKKEHHLNPGVMKYIQNHAQEVSVEDEELQQSHMVVYYFDL